MNLAYHLVINLLVVLLWVYEVALLEGILEFSYLNLVLHYSSGMWKVLRMFCMDHSKILMHLAKDSLLRRDNPSCWFSQMCWLHLLGISVTKNHTA